MVGTKGEKMMTYEEWREGHVIGMGMELGIWSIGISILWENRIPQFVLQPSNILNSSAWKKATVGFVSRWAIWTYAYMNIETRKNGHEEGFTDHVCKVLQELLEILAGGDA